MDSRRDFLKKAALLSGAAGIANFVPMSIQQAMAINAEPGSTYMDAEHIVILMQENRSFDHCFGALKGVRGFNDPRAINLPNKNKVWLQSNAKGETYAPFRLDIRNTKATWMHSLPHSWRNQVEARNDGKYDQWLNVKRNSDPNYADMPLTLGYHTREDLPFYYALADAFTVCDHNFCSSLTGTNPNRLHFWTGTIRAEQNENSRAHVWNEDMDYGTLNWKTFPERLEENNISWKCYQNEIAIDNGFEGEEDAWLSNFQDNPLEFFGQYNIRMHESHARFLQKKLVDLQAGAEELRKKIAGSTANTEQLNRLKDQLKTAEKNIAAATLERDKSTSEKFDALTDHQKNIHRKAFDNNKNHPDYRKLTELKYQDGAVERTLKVPLGDVLHQFREDVNTGKLPMVSWLSAPENFSDHPTSAWYGAWYVSELLDILTRNPEVWKKTIFILAYDENDGYFDHVPPFVAPHSQRPETGKVSQGIDTRTEFVTLEQEKARNNFPEPYERESPIGLGYRVPLVIASPWSKGGWVNSEVFDHTSTLKFLETFLSKKTGKEIKETNISDWRRTICGDLTSVFRPYAGDQIPQVKPLAQKVFLEGIHQARFKKLPDNFKALSAEEISQVNKDSSLSLYMPKQETGIKPSSALPYQLYVDGKLSADKKSFEICFDNRTEIFGKKTAGSPFNVYAPGKYRQHSATGTAQFEPVRTWAYGVKAGDVLTDNWPLQEFEGSLYYLQVYGPNGFYREFKGSTNDTLVEISMDYNRNRLIKNKLTGDVTFILNNLSGKNQVIKITDHSYGQPTIKRELTAGDKNVMITLNLNKSHGWYDFGVSLKDNSSFVRRYAGRVETGSASFTDPKMGGIV